MIDFSDVTTVFELLVNNYSFPVYVETNRTTIGCDANGNSIGIGDFDFIASQH